MESASLDAVDRRLLALLEANGRESHAMLARRVGLSRSAVQERIARLERAGVIAAYTVKLGARRGAQTQGYILVSHEGPNHEAQVAQIFAIPEVKRCESMSGDVDLLLRVEAPTLADINRVRDLVGALPGVTRTRTLLVMASRFARE